MLGEILRPEEKGSEPVEMEAGEREKRLSVLWKLSWPAIVEQMLSMLVSYADTAMVGALGAEATAAVAVVSSSIWTVGGILASLGVGYSVQVANAVGAQDEARVRRIIRQGALAAVVVGLLVLCVMQLLASSIPRWLGAEPEVYPLAVSYLRWVTLGLPFSTALAIFSAILRCTGDTRTPLMLNGLSNVVNIGLNFLLIYPTRSWYGLTIPGAGLGVSGAAIGTAASVALAGCLMIRHTFFRRGHPMSLGPEERYRPDGEIIRTAIGLGLPCMWERMTINLGQILMTGLVAHVGTVALAANHIAVTVEGICYLPAFGVSFAATALVGQAVGAGSRENARAYGVLSGWLGLWMSVGTGGLLFLLAPWLAGLFSPDGAVVAETVKVLRIVAFAEPCFGLSIVLSGALRGASDVRFPMVCSLGSMWGVRMVAANVLVYQFGWGLEAIWLSMAADLVLRGILCTLRWHSPRWERLAGL